MRKRGTRLLAIVLAVVMAVMPAASAFGAERDAASTSAIMTSDVFYLYPKILRTPDPDLNRLLEAGKDAIETMEADGGGIISLIQSAFDDPLEGTKQAILDWIKGTDSRGKDCSMEATEALLKQLGQSSELYEFFKECTGPYQDFYKIAKSVEDVDTFITELSEFYVGTQNEQIMEVITVLLSDETGTVRELLLEGDMEADDRKILIKAMDKGAEGVSDAMELLKWANRFTELVELIVLMENVDDEMLNYLLENVESDDLKEALNTYKGYKESNYISYITEKWIKEDVLEGALDTFKDGLKETMGNPVVPAYSLYKCLSIVFKYYGKLLGKISGYGDADALITAYKSYNFVVDLGRAVDRKVSVLQFHPSSTGAVYDYLRAYEMYCNAVIAFAEKAKEVNKNASSNIDGRMAVILNLKDEIGLCNALINHCKELLQDEDCRNDNRLETADVLGQAYTIYEGEKITIRLPSDVLLGDSIYTDSEGNLPCGIKMLGGELVVACDVNINGDMTSGEVNDFVVRIEKGASLQVGGDLCMRANSETTNHCDARYVINDGKLTVKGNMELYVTDLVMSDNTASLKVDGDTILIDNPSVSGGTLVFNGALKSWMREIGSATIYLNTPAEKTVSLAAIDLEPASSAAGTAADIVLKQTKAGQDGVAPEYELTGSAPSHELSVHEQCTQIGDASFSAIRMYSFSTQVKSGYTLTGNTQVTGNVTAEAYTNFDLKIANGASLIVPGDMIMRATSETYNHCDTRNVINDGKLTVKGNMELYVTDLVMSDNVASLKLDGDTILIDNPSVSGGTLVFNGALQSWMREIGSATIYLNTPAGKNVSLAVIDLTPASSNEETGAGTADIVLKQTKAGQDGSEPEYELTGSAPSHELSVHEQCTQRGDASFDAIRLYSFSTQVKSGYTLTGNTQIAGDVTGEAYTNFALKITDGASLHVPGDMIMRVTSETYNRCDIRRVEDHGNLVVDGKMELYYTSLAMSGDDARLEIGGNAVIDKYEAMDGTSPIIALNGTEKQSFEVYGWEGALGILENNNTSSDGITFGMPVYVGTLFEHHRAPFLLSDDDETQFVDFDGDGVKDHLDPYPQDPNIAFLDYTISSAADPAWVDGTLVPPVTVTDEEGTVLKEGIDYDVIYEYEEANEIVRVIVTGKGFHSVQREAEFPIDVEHFWDEGIVTVEPTCTEDGVKVWTCSLCHKQITEVIPALGHKWDDGIVTKEATCTEPGVITFTCSVCGDTRDEAIDPSGHTLSQPERENEIAPTCTESGSYDEVVYCETCGEELSRETTKVLAKGHQEEALPDVDPTCTEPGKTAGSHCSVCGEVIVAQEEIPALGHDWDDGTVTKEATVEEEGEMTYTCRRCGETKNEVIPKLDIISVTAVTLDSSDEEMPTSQTIKEKPYTITKASTLQLTAKIEPENATNKNITWSSSDPAVATVDENGVVTALTYGKTTITVTTEDGKKNASCQIQTRYNDVADSGRYWFNPAYWAADNNITKGYANIYFGPEENCTREQMITFLYRTAGSPAVSGSISFSDVKKGSYYYNAVLWAYKNGITKGYSSGPNKGKFGVGLNVTREDTVTFIYRMAGKPKYSTTKSFKDVAKGKYYYDPVRWAAQNNITKGYADGTFGVGKDVLRKDIVTFLYRYAGLK